jgi:hypothetical protein
VQVAGLQRPRAIEVGVGVLAVVNGPALYGRAGPCSIGIDVGADASVQRVVGVGGLVVDRTTRGLDGDAGEPFAVVVGIRGDGAGAGIGLGRAVAGIIVGVGGPWRGGDEVAGSDGVTGGVAIAVIVVSVAFGASAGDGGKLVDAVVGISGAGAVDRFPSESRAGVIGVGVAGEGSTGAGLVGKRGEPVEIVIGVAGVDSSSGSGDGSRQCLPIAIDVVAKEDLGAGGASQRAGERRESVEIVVSVGGSTLTAHAAEAIDEAGSVAGGVVGGGECNIGLTGAAAGCDLSDLPSQVIVRVIQGGVGIGNTGEVISFIIRI